MIRDSITILKGKPNVFVNRDKNKITIFFVSPAEIPNRPPLELLRCLNHIRDAVHSDSVAV